MRSLLLAVHYDRWILPALMVIPILGAFVIWFATKEAPHTDDREYEEGLIPRDIALGTLVLEFVLSLGMLWAFDPAATGWQFVADLPWLPDWGARYTVGVDGLSLLLVLLTTFLMPFALLGDWTSVRHKLRSHYALFLLLGSGLIGAFVALDLLLFYVMWEIMLVPMYFIIGMWGGERRLYASIKFFLYTMVGSLLMLIAIIVLWREAGGTSFNYDWILANAHPSPSAALWLFGAFALCFAIKVPLFPFHTWLPDAHVEAPTGGSVVLAGVMLKMGTFGFIRYAIPFFPEAAMQPNVRLTILGLSVISILYGALVALVQTDLKKLVAYSSVSHLGFVMLGIFAMTVTSVQGAMFVMLSHGLTTGGLFLMVGMLYERTHTRQLSAFGGLARVVPLFSAALTITAMGSIGLPGTSGFVGEFLVLLGSYRTSPWLTVGAAVGIVLAAAYLLWALQRVIFNPMTNSANDDLADLNPREMAVMATLTVFVIFLGVYPKPVLNLMEPAAARFVHQVEQAQRATPVAATSRP